MGKKIEISDLMINNILLDSKYLSLRKLSKKYSYDKNVIIRILKTNNNDDFYDNIDHIVCKKTNKIFYDIKNNSGILTKHLKSINIYDDIDNLTNYIKLFNIFIGNVNLISFNKFLRTLRIRFEKKIMFNGLIKYYFPTKNKYIFFIENNKIKNNNKIRPILFFKIKNRYDNSIFIYEDEWLNKKEIVELKIKIILNSLKLEKIFARKCIINEITPKIKNDFLNKNHIQGTTNSTISLGAYYNNELVAVMTFTNYRNLTNDKIKFDYELNRFATNIKYHVIGIGGKLLKHFLNKYGKNSSILSFGDRRHVLNSKNNIYNALNFTLVGISKHDYTYIKNDSINRVHKITMQTKFKRLNINVKEFEYYERNGFKKIWDCGKYKFRYQSE
jgi:hypothetical protein